MTWTIARVEDGAYELRDASGSVVTSYETERMEHPTDWIGDATEAGGDGWAISSGDWEYVDER